MIDKEYQPYFAAHTELQDASDLECLKHRFAPGAASIEIAKILTVFEGQIDDEWRHDLIMVGGGLLKLQRELREENSDGR